MDVSNNIKAIRVAKGIAQAEIARRLELDPSSYHRLENRGTKLSIEQAESIAKALGVSLLELLTWGEEKQAHGEESHVVTQLLKKIEDLKRRIKELEDRVKDKSEIIENTKFDYEAIKEIANNVIESPILNFALLNGIGDALVRNETDDSTRVMTMEEFNDEENPRSLVAEEYVESLKLTDEQVLLIMKMYLENDIYSHLMHEMIDNGEVRDKQIVRVYKKWEKKNFEDMKRAQKVGKFE